jgi:hemerythrin-like domain-containing protein
MASTRTPNLAKDLICIHKVITRGLEVSHSEGRNYALRRSIHPRLVSGYSSYIHCLATVLDAHHTGEDLITFPEFRKLIPSAPYISLATDHQKIEELLSFIPPALKNLNGDIPQAGLEVIVDTLGKITEVWYPHIKQEEQYFSEEALSQVLDLENQERISAAAGKHSQDHSEPANWVIPFILYNLQGEDRLSFSANFPPQVVNELVPKAWKDLWAPMKPYLLD